MLAVKPCGRATYSFEMRREQEAASLSSSRRLRIRPMYRARLELWGVVPVGAFLSDMFVLNVILCSCMRVHYFGLGWMPGELLSSHACAGSDFP